jgi:hypothetical protein
VDGTEVSGPDPVGVLRIGVRAEGADGILQALRIGFPGLEDVETTWRRLQAGLYPDDDGDGAADAGSIPLAAAYLERGSAFLGDIDLRVIPGQEPRQLVLALAVTGPRSTPAGGCSPAAPGSLLALALMGAWTLLCRRRRWAMIALLVLVVAFMSSCVRYGYYRSVVEARAEITGEADVQAEPAVSGDTLHVRLEAPVEGGSFLVDLSK